MRKIILAALVLFACNAFADDNAASKEAQNFVLAKARQISLQKTGSASGYDQYIADATELAGTICKSDPGSRDNADYISDEACRVVAEKVDSQRKLLAIANNLPANAKASTGN